MKENQSPFEDKEKLAENKLIILYIMQKVSYPLSNSQILRLLYDFGNFNYYYFQHLLSDLVEQNYVMNYQQEEEWLYKITHEGSNILELTENMIPGIVKYKLDILVQNLLKSVKYEATVTAEYIPTNDDSYITKCKITEAHQTLFELNIYCATQEQAKSIADNWQNNAIHLYPQFIDMLTKKERLTVLFYCLFISSMLLDVL